MKWLKDHAERNPDRQCINEWTYREVCKKVTGLAGKLDQIVKEEKRVALLSENSPEMAVFLYALLLLKKEVFLLNKRLTAQEIRRQTKNLGIRQIFSSGKEYCSFEEVQQVSGKQAAYDWEICGEQIAVILNTSATTGHCKSVPIRWKQLQAHVRASAEVLGVREEDNWLAVLPLFHISGLSVLFRSLFNGTGVTILEKYEKETVCDLISTGSINMISLVPTVLTELVLDMPKHHLRVILLGGDFIPGKLVEQCREKKLPLYKTYGMTETTSQSTTFSVLEYPQKKDSVGRPLPGVKIEIRNPGRDGIGEIWIKSPMLMDGYLTMEPVTGFFHTGDIGYLDAEGFLYVLNRREDLIISGGENIYPKEIEDLLYQLPGVTECAVTAIEDSKWGQVPVLYVVSELREEALKTYMEKRLAKYKIPKQIFFREGLPKNASGKIVRNLLREER